MLDILSQFIIADDFGNRNSFLQKNVNVNYKLCEVKIQTESSVIIFA